MPPGGLNRTRATSARVVEWDLTSRLWAVLTTSLAAACLALGLSLVVAIERSRQNVDSWTEGVAAADAIARELNRLGHELAAAQSVPETSAGRLLARFRSRWGREPAARGLLADSRIFLTRLEEAPPAALAEPCRELAGRWQKLRTEFQFRLLGSLSGPLEMWQHAGMLSVLACLGAVLIVLLQRRYRRHLVERMAAEHALRDSEMRYRELFENVLEGVYQMSPDGRIIDANPALLDLFECGSIAELEALNPEIGCRAGEAAGPEAPTLILRNREAALKTRSGREIIVLENRRTVVGLGGEVLYFEGTLVDITERKRTEQALVEHARAAEAARAVSDAQAARLAEQSEELAATRNLAVERGRQKLDFIARLSQEIRAPLESVISISRHLRTSFSAPDQRASAEAAASSAESLLALFENIVELVRLEATPVNLERAPFAITGTAERVVDEIAPLAESKNLDLALYVDPALPPWLAGDAGRLERMLLHTVDHAVHLAAGGDVTVSVSAGGEAAGGRIPVCFIVAVTQPSFVVEHPSELFEPFYRPEQSPAGQPAPCLGLAITRRLVEAMKGQISVESSPDRGTQFSFRVELEAAEGPDPYPRSALSALKGRTVLIASAASATGECLVRTIRAWGIDALRAGSAEEALELARSSKISGPPVAAVIVDMDLGGARLAAELVRDSSGIEAPVLLVARNSLRGCLYEPVIEGVYGAVAKPVRLSELLPALAACAAEDAARWKNRRTAPAGPGGSPEGGQSGATALVADDNIVSQRVLLRLLEKLGIKADSVSNGLEAVEAMAARSYQLVLMDCTMPEMDGYEATAKIRETEPAAQHTPIIAITAHSLHGERDRCLKAGMDDYIAKPVDLEQLRAKVEQWCPSVAR